MSLGELLDELRRRLILSIVGFVLALGICLYFGDSVVGGFCLPLMDVLTHYKINPQLVADELSEGFAVYIRISAITAISLASPWILYQLWLFVAAGLYPSERKYVTRYLPLSMALLVSGMLFVYFFVLPWTLSFFVEFNSRFSVHLKTSPVVQAVATSMTPTVPLNIPMLSGDPAGLHDGDTWFDTQRGVLKLFYRNEVRIISINSSNLLAQEYKLSHYISLVVTMLITFGLCFQLPLVVLALERIGIVEIESLCSARRGVYFAMVIAAAVITPGDMGVTTIALMLPLIALYELGILLARLSRRRELRGDEN